MSFSLLPTWRAEDVTQVTTDFLSAQNVRLLMLDFDNTIIPYTTNTPTEAVISWLHTVSEMGITVCVVSNSKKNRVRDSCKKYELHCITHAKKPFSKGINQCISQFGIPKNQAILIGDQIFTDTLGGNCAGVATVLVRSIHNHTFWLKLRHVAEMPFILLAKNRRIQK